MNSTDKPRPRVPAPPPSSLQLGSVAPTPKRSHASRVTPEQTPPLPDDSFVGWDAGPDLITAICEYNVVGDWELRQDLDDFSLGGSSKCTISIAPACLVTVDTLQCAHPNA